MTDQGNFGRTVGGKSMKLQGSEQIIQKRNPWTPINRNFFVKQIAERLEHFVEGGGYGKTVAHRDLANRVRNLPQLPNMNTTLIAAVLAAINREDIDFIQNQLVEYDDGTEGLTFDAFDDLFPDAAIEHTYHAFAILTKKPNKGEAIDGLRIDLFRYYMTILTYIHGTQTPKDLPVYESTDSEEDYFEEPVLSDEELAE